MFNFNFFSNLRNLIHFFTITITIAIIVVQTSCATTPLLTSKKVSKHNLDSQIKKYLTESKSINDKTIRIKIKQFKKALAKGNLSNDEWKLHDELLNAYINLKNRIGTKILVPPNTKIVIPFETYCLNSSKAAPDEREIYHWQKDSPGIPYYKDLLKLRRENQITSSELQTLLWNLQNETRWDNYSDRLKAVLQKIDPQASIKLPSEIKDHTKSIITDSILGLPGVSSASDAYDIVKGKYYQFEDFKRSIENITSKYELGEYDNLTQIPGTNLYSQSDSEGFHSQTIIFFNTTDQGEELNIEDYYLAPEREDVQRIGLNPKEPTEQDLFNELENVLYQDMARLGLGFTPGLNDVADVYELLTGKDFVSGATLSAAERLFSGIGIVVGSGASYRYVKRVLVSPVNYLNNFSKGLEKVSNKIANLSTQGIKETTKYVHRANRIVEVQQNIRSTHGNSYVQKLPNLTESLKEAFDGHVFKGTYEPGEILFQAQRSNQKSIGNWFGPIKPMDSKHADELFNIQKWGNDASDIKTFVVKERVSGYAGKVAGGEGHQFFIPPGVPLEKILIEVK